MLEFREGDIYMPLPILIKGNIKKFFHVFWYFLDPPPRIQKKISNGFGRFWRVSTRLKKISQTGLDDLNSGGGGLESTQKR